MPPPWEFTRIQIHGSNRVNGKFQNLIFEDTKFQEKMLVEKVGVQTQTSSRDPKDLSLRRIAVGPNLYFRADGSRDPDPIHYWEC